MSKTWGVHMPAEESRDAVAEGSAHNISQQCQKNWRDFDIHYVQFV